MKSRKHCRICKHRITDIENDTPLCYICINTVLSESKELKVRMDKLEDISLIRPLTKEEKREIDIVDLLRMWLKDVST